MAKETEGSLGASLALSEAGLGTMTAAVGIISQIKGLLYDISRNPLAAPLAVLGVENQIGRVIQQIKNLKEESKKTNQEFSLMKDPRSWMAVGSSVLAIGLRLRSIRDEIEKTRVSLIKMGGESTRGTAYGTGFEGAMGLTKAQLSMQSTYGKEFADQFKKTVEQMQSRVLREGMPASRQQKMFEVLTGLSMATGIDYGQAIATLQDHMSNYKVGSMEALSAVDLIRDAWNRGDTAIGNLNDNIESGTELLTEFVAQGMKLPEATRSMLEMNQAASQLGLTTQGMMQAFRSTSGLREFGQQGIQQRLQLMAGIQTTGGMNNKMKDILSPFTKQGLRPEEAVFALQRSSPGKFMEFMQQYARRVIPTTKTGEIDEISLAKNANQVIRSFQMVGMSLEDMTKLVRGETVDIKQPATTLNDKMRDVADRGLAQFDSKLNAVLESAGTWQESLDAMAKKLPMDFGLLSQSAIFAMTALGGLTFAAGALRDILRIRQTMMGGGGAGTGGGFGYGGGYTSTTSGQFGMPAGQRGGRSMQGFLNSPIGMKTFIGGMIANQVASQFLEEPQGITEGLMTNAAGMVPFGTVAAVAGQKGGRGVAYLLQKMFGTSGEEAVTGGVAGEEDPINALLREKAAAGDKDAARFLRDNMATETARNRAFSSGYEQKYGEGAGGKGPRGSQAPMVSNQISVYLDSEKIATRVEEKQTFTESTTPKTLD